MLEGEEGQPRPLFVALANHAICARDDKRGGATGSTKSIHDFADIYKCMLLREA
jgi:hypothetical protein